jgi:hypothetical protein
VLFTWDRRIGCQNAAFLVLTFVDPLMDDLDSDSDTDSYYNQRSSLSTPHHGSSTIDYEHLDFDNLDFGIHENLHDSYDLHDSCDSIHHNHILGLEYPIYSTDSPRIDFPAKKPHYDVSSTWNTCPTGIPGVECHSGPLAENWNDFFYQFFSGISTEETLEKIQDEDMDSTVC